jgi:uncharacterized membrane protein
MTDIERQIENLTKQLQELRSRQMQMNSEMVLVERELKTLKATVFASSKNTSPQEVPVEQSITPETTTPYILQAQRRNEERKKLVQKKPFHLNREMEDFIGTNVISKIGILVTIIGVFIGAKYAIDNELISALMRIVAGYFAAAALIFVAIRLKKKYAYFSSVLIGGGLAVTYFITYIAYSFYALFPLPVAFVMMVATTITAVGIALWYNQKIIALLGQVAAYAIPFLLSSGQGNIFILLGYITCINTGLLILSFKKDWKLLYHIAFFLTWIIYLFSTVVTTRVATNFSAGFIFLTLNFITFYVTFLSYKIYKKELYQVGEIAILLLNALFFFFIGCFIIEQQFHNNHFLTFFTVANAAVHFVAGYLIYRLQLVDKSVFQFILSLGLLFITVAIPIELDGNWVTILWTMEATTLVYIARNTSRELYLEIAMPLIAISFISLLQDWSSNYPFINNSFISARGKNKIPFINLNFTLSLFVCACFGYMSYYSSKIVFNGKKLVTQFFNKILPLAFLAILYFTFYNEIHFAWDENITSYNNKAFVLYQALSLVLFSCLYFAGWIFANYKFIKREDLHHLLIVLALFANAVFLLSGLDVLGDLRRLYISTGLNALTSFLFIRYLSFIALAMLWIIASRSLGTFKPSDNLSRGMSITFNITLLCILSNEFIHWMDLAGYQNQYKLGLSLIWGSYALTLLFSGMIKNKKHLRILAMVLFAVTLLKLFFYDLVSLSTISKTIVLVLLGILLLLASFLYNKYKDLLFNNDDAVVQK